MDHLKRAMFAAIDRNHESRALADRLNAISVRRRKKRTSSCDAK